MDVSAVSGFSPALSFINALYPTSRVSLGTGAAGVSALGDSQAGISSLGRLLNAAESLHAAAGALAAPDAFAARTAASSKDKVTTGTATAATPLGAYSVQVSQVAQAQTLTTAAQWSSVAAIGSGGATTLDFQFASGVARSVSLGSGANTLTGIAAAVNGAKIGVKAEVVHSSAGYQLSLTGQTGAANAFTIGVSGDPAVADLLAHPSGGSGPALATLARDAQGTINGSAFVASTNTVATAVDGLTLSLKGVGSATLTVAPNSGQVNKAGAFVEAYNGMQAGLGHLGGENPVLGVTVSFLRNQLAATLDTSANGLTGSLSSLAQVGINRTGNGTLALDSGKFQGALNANPEGVTRLFSNDGKGVAERITALAADALSPERLLQSASPALTSPATVARSLQAGLWSSLTGGQGQTVDYSASVNLADQFLQAQLAGTGAKRNGQGSNGLLLDQMISRSVSLSQNLATLGTRLHLAGLL
ncbi:MAG: flagellar capping protein [Rhodocyclaceae bacterium]|nr:flagellar capping protein [Rhodocyclaceae bacterium]